MSVDNSKIAAQKEGGSFLQRLKFTVSLAYNYILRRPHHNRIIGDEMRMLRNSDTGDTKQVALGDIYLGGLPMHNVAGHAVRHHEKISHTLKDTGKPLGLVVGVVEKFELESQTGMGLFTPVAPTVWVAGVKEKEGDKKHVVQFKQVPIPDFSAKANNKDLYDAVKAIQKTREESKSVYIHCKAGRARSVLLLVCYLMTEYKDPREGPNKGLPLQTIQEAHDLIKKERPHIDFNVIKKQDVVKGFIDYYNKMEMPKLVIASEPITIPVPRSTP